jgi:serine/threonine protein kinase
MSGKVLGHYRVGKPLGRGGSGQVYLADDLSLDRLFGTRLVSQLLDALLHLY